MQRPSSRLLVMNGGQQILLFKFQHSSGPLAGSSFWATPGGGLDEGESFKEAAKRELYGEVGLQVDDPGREVARRTARFMSPTGEQVEADERYFLILADTDGAADA